jgi:hypothetical protein
LWNRIDMKHRIRGPIDGSHHVFVKPQLLEQSSAGAIDELSVDNVAQLRIAKTSVFSPERNGLG